MLHSASKAAVLLIGMLSAGGTGFARAESIEIEGVQESGSIFRISLPNDTYDNGCLIIWIHAFQDATEPVHIPEQQMQFGDVSLPELANQLGFGFATNSFSKTGLAVRQGMEDILDLVSIYEYLVGPPDKIYLIGASKGGLITTLLLEQYPHLFAGGLAVAGPIGSFVKQIEYLGDARATFEFYFPGLIPGDPFHPPALLAEGWSGPEGFFETEIEPVLRDPRNHTRLFEWAAVARLPYDDADPLETLLLTARDVLQYVVVNLNEATDTLGGFPFDNQRKWYSGSSSPRELNAAVPRAAADPVALLELEQHYTPTGVLQRPLMTLHTTRDPLVPHWHEIMYTRKNLESGSYLTQRVNLNVDRYGHCQVTLQEALFMFGLLLGYNEDLHLLHPALDEAGRP